MPWLMRSRVWRMTCCTRVIMVPRYALCPCKAIWPIGSALRLQPDATSATKRLACPTTRPVIASSRR